MNKIPGHIKFIYIMMLKHNRTAKSLMKRDIISWEEAVNIGGIYLDLEKTARDLIRKYMVLQ